LEPIRRYSDLDLEDNDNNDDNEQEVLGRTYSSCSTTCSMTCNIHKSYITVGRNSYFSACNKLCM